MKILLYLLIINSFMWASQPIKTKQLIIPIVNLQETSQNKQISFIGFEGQPGQQKKAALYFVDSTGKPVESNLFTFILPENKNSSFFSAHTGSFINKEENHLVLLVSDPTTGTKAYVWLIKEEGFDRVYSEPFIINSKNTKAQPIKAISIKEKETNLNAIMVSFGSPNREIALLKFTDKEIIKEAKIAKGFLQNQAGSIFFLHDEKKEETTVYNGGVLTQSRTYIKNIPTNATQEHKVQGTINEATFINNKKALLVNHNSLYFSDLKKKINLNPLYKHTKIIKTQQNTIEAIDDQGTILTYKLNLEENQATLITKINTPFKELVKIKFIEILIEKNQQIFSAQTEEENFFYIQGKQEEKKEEKKEPLFIISEADTLILTVGQKKEIPIKRNNNLEFLSLTIEEQPQTLEVNLDSMAFVWTPKKTEVGNNIIKYNVVYNLGENIVKSGTTEGKTRLNKEIIEEENTQIVFIYVNDPPIINMEKTKHTIQAGHTLEAPFVIEDLNKEQKVELSYSPIKENINLKEGSLIWTPTNDQQGNHEIKIIAKDQYAQTELINTIFVDTTKESIKNTRNFILTVNEEFILDISLKEKAIYNIIEGPENARISSTGKLHWIPIQTQLGANKITIERKGEQNTTNYILNTFVNSPPVISYRPDNTEYINLNEEFIFEFKSFDANLEQKTHWSLLTESEDAQLIENNVFRFKGNELDYSLYSVIATDSINEDVFDGEVYVNYIPKIISKPKEFIQLGDSLNYQIIVEDKNTISPHKKNKENEVFYKIKNKPEGMELEKNTLKWRPTKEEIGLHDIEVLISDGLYEQPHKFTINVNDKPKITGPDSLMIMIGDTLNHIINATDENINTELTYSIRTTISDMFLNANTGQITWAPKPKDLGVHFLEVAVSDGFETGTNMQKITVIVEGLPCFLNSPQTEAYVGLDYVYYIKAEDAEGNKEPGKDIFIALEKTSLQNSTIEEESFVFSSTPTKEDIGKQTISFALSDKKQNIKKQTFEVLVLENSPCDQPEENQETIKKTSPPEKEKKLKRIYKILIGLISGGLIKIHL